MTLRRATRIAVLAAASMYVFQQLVGWAAPLFHSWLHMMAQLGG